MRIFDRKDLFVHESNLKFTFEIDVSPHTLTSEWIVITNARVLFTKFQLREAQFACAYNVYRYFLCTMIGHHEQCVLTAIQVLFSIGSHTANYFAQHTCRHLPVGLLCYFKV